MANETILPIRDIPGTGTPSATSMVALDSGVAMFPAELATLADAVRPMASESEAEAGVDAVKGMSPLTVKRSIASEVGDTLASASQGALADTAVQPARSISAGAGLTGGGDLSADRSISLNAASISSLAKADSAVQPGVTITAGTGLTGGGDLSANRTLSLNSASVASLAKADAAVLYTAQTLTAPQQTLVRTQIGLGNVDNTADASKPISSATQTALNAKADASRTITAGTGLTGGGDLTANRSIGLSASSVASLGRADTAVQATGTSAQYIRGDGVFAAFPSIPQGTVTSVAATVPTGLAISGSPITSSGTLAISYASGYVGYTTAEQTKLSGIAAGAQVNTVTSVAGKTGAVTLVKADVGLGNVDNTSDANKPVSTATQTALNAKANTTTTISAGTGLDGGGTLAANRSLALNAASIASLAKADSAVQLGANGSMPAGGAAGQILAKSSAADYAVGWISSEAATAVSYGPQTLTGPQQTQAQTNIGGTSVGRAVFTAADGAAAQDAIGATATGKSLITAANQAAARTAIGAQADLGYTPVNKAGDVMTGALTVQAATANCRVTFRNTSSTLVAETGVGVGTGFGDSYGAFVSNSTGGMYFGTNGATRLSINSAGAVSIPGSLAKGSGTFLTDHPLDPLNRNLRHGFVEAPRYDLIYRGAAKLVDGVAKVDIDAASNMTSGTFAALTTNARVTSLQNQDGFERCKPGPIMGGSFQIICEDDTCTDEIVWVVIAERNDPFVKSDMDQNCDSDGRFVPEFDKASRPSLEP